MLQSYSIIPGYPTQGSRRNSGWIDEQSARARRNPRRRDVRAPSRAPSLQSLVSRPRQPSSSPTPGAATVHGVAPRVEGLCSAHSCGPGVDQLAGRGRLGQARQPPLPRAQLLRQLRKHRDHGSPQPDQPGAAAAWPGGAPTRVDGRVLQPRPTPEMAMPAVTNQAAGRAPAGARRRPPRVRPAAPLDPDRRQRGPSRRPPPRELRPDAAQVIGRRGRRPRDRRGQQVRGPPPRRRRRDRRRGDGPVDRPWRRATWTFRVHSNGTVVPAAKTTSQTGAAQRRARSRRDRAATPRSPTS